MKRQELAKLIEKMGQRYTEVLGINVDTGDDKEILKWFLAAILFGAPIRESSAIKTYRAFEKHRMVSSEKIVKTGWEGLVKILDEGGYTRYDYKTADKLLLVMDNLNTKYEGSLNRLHQQATDSAHLENLLKKLGKGIGNITTSIFLRELRGTWKKADPKPTPPVVSAAIDLKIIESENPQEALTELKNFWKRSAVKGETFVNFETALLRWKKQNRHRVRKTV